MRVIEYIFYMCIVSRIEFIVLFHCHLGFLVKNSGSLVAVEGHRQTPKKHTSKPLNWFLCVSYIQTALNLAISLLREYQHVCATLCACPCKFNVVQATIFLLYFAISWRCSLRACYAVAAS